MDLATTLVNMGAVGACLVSLSLAVWRVGVWLGGKLDRLIERHFKFLDDLQQAMMAQSQALQAMVEDQRKASEAQQRILVRQEQILDMVEKMLQRQETIMERQQKGG